MIGKYWVNLYDQNLHHMGRAGSQYTILPASCQPHKHTISRKMGSLPMHQKVKDRSMSSFSSPQVVSLINQIVKNDLATLCTHRLAMINVIATTIEDELRDEYLQTILPTYKQYTSFSVILAKCWTSWYCGNQWILYQEKNLRVFSKCY